MKAVPLHGHHAAALLLGDLARHTWARLNRRLTNPRGVKKEAVKQEVLAAQGEAIWPEVKVKAGGPTPTGQRGVSQPRWRPSRRRWSRSMHVSSARGCPRDM